MPLRRLLALIGALGVLLSPGAGGLARLVAEAPTCGCSMGPGCPMCAARRLREQSEAQKARSCPCRLQRQGGPSSAVRANPRPQDLARFASRLDLAAQFDCRRSAPAASPPSDRAIAVPRRPPRATL